MKQIAILSGKGGSGKTSLSAALIDLINQEYSLVMIDADVDASNLDLLISCKQQTRQDFWGGQKAVIDQENCIQCGDCLEHCRFYAVRETQADPGSSTRFSIDPYLCEGCAVCAQQCPVSAISMHPTRDGVWYQSQSAYGMCFHAHLFAGHENSGKLVSTIISAARQYTQINTIDFTLVDGPPGIGCPVIAVCNQSDLAVIVTEPTPSGIHDMKRILDTTRHFHIPAYVVINKSDLHLQNTEQIIKICQRDTIPVLGRIPFDPQFNQAVLHAQPITRYAASSPSSSAVREIWQKLKIQMHQ